MKRPSKTPPDLRDDERAALRAKAQDLARDPVKRLMAELIEEGRAGLWGPAEMREALKDRVWPLCVRLGDLRRAQEVLRMIDRLPEVPDASDHPDAGP